MKTLIVSDLHLGACNSRTDLLAGLLASDYDRLILNGDTVDSPDPRRFRPCAWQVVDRLRAVARNRELVVVRGNHDVLPGPANDRGTTRYLAELLGTKVVDEYELGVGADRYLVTHGDVFDGTMNLTWVGDVADWFYCGIQRVSRPLAHRVKGLSKHVCGVVEAVQRGAMAQARQRGYAGVITGHTHFCHDEFIDGLHYLNTGCWVDHPCSYICVEGGTARLLHWEEAASWRRPRRVVSAAAIA
jgi:UDP-2,3-diacylglucosamine pyrophosphatase LpxH